MINSFGKRTLIRSAFVATMLGAALSANAWLINIHGTYNPSTGIITGTNYIYSSAPGLSSSLVYGYWIDGGGNLTSATFTDGPNSLSMTGTGTSVVSGGTFSFSGAWTATSIVGVNTKPTGTYSGDFDGVGEFSLSVVGQPVPEPVSLAVMGVGLAGVVARRRRQGK